MSRRWTRLAWVALAAAWLLSAAEKPVDWAAVEAERDLQRRASLALDYARQQVEVVVACYQDGRPQDAQAALGDLVRGVETAQRALDETGKVARKRPKHFKRAEIATRRLVGAIEDAQRVLLAAEREQLEPAKERVDEINQQLLSALFKK